MSTAEVINLGRWTPDPDIATKLRAIRRGYAKLLDRKIPQREFAEIIGYGAKAYGAWEAGTNQPDDLIELATRLYERIGLDPSYLVDFGTGPADPAEQVSQSFPCLTDDLAERRFRNFRPEQNAA